MPASTSDASDTSRITQSITYKDTGVKLSVTPSVDLPALATVASVGEACTPDVVAEWSGARHFVFSLLSDQDAFFEAYESVIAPGLSQIDL